MTLQTTRFLALASLAIVTACGSTTSTSGTTTTTDTTSGSGADTTSTADTTTTTDTTSTTDTASSADTSTGGGSDSTGNGDGQGGGGGGDGGGGGGNDKCQTCIQASCTSEFSACAGDATCSPTMQATGACLQAAGSDAAAQQKCFDTFANSGAPGKALLQCIQANCAAECI